MSSGGLEFEMSFIMYRWKQYYLRLCPTGQPFGLAINRERSEKDAGQENANERVRLPFWYSLNSIGWLVSLDWFVTETNLVCGSKWNHSPVLVQATGSAAAPESTSRNTFQGTTHRHEPNRRLSARWWAAWQQQDGDGLVEVAPDSVTDSGRHGFQHGTHINVGDTDNDYASIHPGPPLRHSDQGFRCRSCL